MPAESGIQDFKYLNKIKNWIPAPRLKPAGTGFAGMTALSSEHGTVSMQRRVQVILFVGS